MYTEKYHIYKMLNQAMALGISCTDTEAEVKYLWLQHQWYVLPWLWKSSTCLLLWSQVCCHSHEQCGFWLKTECLLCWDRIQVVWYRSMLTTHHLFSLQKHSLHLDSCNFMMQRPSWKTNNSTASEDIEISLVLTAVDMQIIIFSDVMQYNLQERYQCFRETCCHNFQCRRWKQ